MLDFYVLVSAALRVRACVCERTHVTRPSGQAEQILIQREDLRWHTLSLLATGQCHCYCEAIDWYFSFFHPNESERKLSFWDKKEKKKSFLSLFQCTKKKEKRATVLSEKNTFDLLQCQYETASECLVCHCCIFNREGGKKIINCFVSLDFPPSVSVK